ncbi:MAG: MFS transporter [Thermoplasmata archaeon]
MQYKWLVLSNTTIATLMASLDTNIVLIALPTIGQQLAGASATSLLWILLGYSLVTAVVLLNFGRLSDMLGRVRLYVVGFAVFTIGSFACGLAPNADALIAFRMLQAIGAGFLFSNSAAIITDAFPPSERGRALGINQVSIVVGSVTGLVLGGIITSTIGWQWIFFVNVPIGAIATWRAHRDLHELAKLQRDEPIDWTGNVVFAAGLALVLIAMTFGSLGQWDALETGSGLALGFALLIGFVLIERKVRFPMLDLSLFRNGLFTDSTAASFLNALARGAFTFVMVFYLQGPPNFLSPFQAGLFLVPVSAALAVAGPVSGTLSDRYGRHWFTISGLVVVMAGFAWLATIPEGAPFYILVGPFVLLGTGMGLFASPNRATMMSAVPPERRGVASGIGTTLVNTGATISLGLTLVIMSQTLPLSSLEAILLGTSSSQSSSVAADFLNGVHVVFLFSAAMVGVALLLLVLRHRARKSTADTGVHVEVTEVG